MSLPETVTAQDELLCIDTNANPFLEGLLRPGIALYPLLLDPYNGQWVLRVKFAPGLTLPLHFHTGCVHLYTLAGCWYYLEHPNQKQVAGSYLYEPGGSVHQFHTPADNVGDTDTFMVVSGANINYDAGDGSYIDLMDAGMIKAWVDAAIVAQGRDSMRYVEVPAPGFRRGPAR